MLREIRSRLATISAAAVLVAACTHQGGAPLSSARDAGDAALMESGRSVFRFETFGNERFFSDILGLDEGLSQRGVTPNMLLASGVQFDADKLPSEFRRVDIGGGSYTDPRGTLRLIEANAVIGLVARQGRVGVTCALCHSRSDGRVGDGVGRRVDGAPNTALASGEILSWAARSRAYLPFVNVSGLGRGPTVDLTAADDPVRIEAAVDAGLKAWPRGQADIMPDGVGNPTDIPAFFAVQDNGPYLWDGSFARVRDASQFFATVVADPTTLATRWGRGFLADGSFWPVGESLGAAYARVLRGIDPSDLWPRATIFRSSVFSLFHDAMDAGFRVSQADVAALTAYMRGVGPPEPSPVDERVADRGRRVFRKSGCDRCHLEAAVASGSVVALSTLLPGYKPGAGGSDNPTTGYDDRLALAPGEDTIANRGYKAPALIGLWMSAPYLHDGSVPTLPELFNPSRGAEAPHPFFVEPPEREALVAYLLVWDGRRYP